MLLSFVSVLVCFHKHAIILHPQRQFKSLYIARYCFSFSSFHALIMKIIPLCDATLIPSVPSGALMRVADQNLMSNVSYEFMYAYVVLCTSIFVMSCFGLNTPLSLSLSLSHWCSLILIIIK